MSRLLRFLGDWKNLATLLAAALVALLVVSYIDNVRSRVEATRNLSSERATATRHIDQLTAQVKQLQAELVDARQGRSTIRAQLDAVIAQLRQLGVEPARPAPTPTGRRTPSPSPAPRPAPSRKPTPHSPSAHPTPSPSPTCWLPIIKCPRADK